MVERDLLKMNVITAEDQATMQEIVEKVVVVVIVINVQEVDMIEGTLFFSF
jgi:hypothetical protein